MAGGEQSGGEKGGGGGGGGGGSQNLCFLADLPISSLSLGTREIEQLGATAQSYSWPVMQTRQLKRIPDISV